MEVEAHPGLQGMSAGDAPFILGIDAQLARLLVYRIAIPGDGIIEVFSLKIKAGHPAVEALGLHHS